jgi:hypothetical protein
MAPFLLAGIAAALWIGVLNKVVQVWRAPEDLPLRALAACVVSATLTFTVNLPPLGPLLDRAGDGARSLAINLGTMAAAYFLLVFFTYSLRGPAARPTVRWQALPLATAALVAVTAWALAPPAVRADPADTANGTHPHATVFVVAVLGYMAWAHAQSLRWSIRYVRTAGTPRLRRGLIVVSVAVAAFLVADATKSLLAVVQAVSEPPAGVVRAATLLYLTGVAAGALAFVVGVSYAAVTGMLITLPIWRAHRRLHHDLEPLWRPLHEAFPQLTLGRVPDTSWRARLGVGSIHYRFYRRVVEIRDGLVQLSPYYATAAHPATHPETTDGPLAARSPDPESATASAKTPATISAELATTSSADEAVTPSAGVAARPAAARSAVPDIATGSLPALTPASNPTRHPPTSTAGATSDGARSADGVVAERVEVRWARLIRDALQAKAAGGDPVTEAEPVFVPGGDNLKDDAELLAGIARQLVAD